MCSTAKQKKPRIAAGLVRGLVRGNEWPYFPVPFRADVCGLLLAPSLTLSWPVLVPVCVGVNVTLIVHLPLAARLVVHVVAETAKSPVVEIAMPVSATV